MDDTHDLTDAPLEREWERRRTPRGSPRPLRVSVVIPTYRRPGQLRRALASVLAQTAISEGGVEIIVVDNNPDASERASVAALSPTAPARLRYVHAHQPGLANARNAGVAAAEAGWIAFLDDDETAAPTWLQQMLEVAAALEADVVFGPVHAVVDEAAPGAATYRAFFSRTGPEEDGMLKSYFGTGNSLIRRSKLPNGGAPFDARRNHTGGEDNLLFKAMMRRGARMAWAARAITFEHPSPDRLQPAYVLRRAFTKGQGTAWEALAGGVRSWPLLIGWMGWGLGQGLWFGLQAAIAPKDRRLELSQQGLQGLGKCLWFPPFGLRHYGL